MKNRLFKTLRRALAVTLAAAMFFSGNTLLNARADAQSDLEKVLIETGAKAVSFDPSGDILGKGTQYGGLVMHEKLTKDGQLLLDLYLCPGEDVSGNFSFCEQQYINESGHYEFTLTLSAQTQEEYWGTWKDGEYTFNPVKPSTSTVTLDYKRPANEFKAPTNPRWDDYVMRWDDDQQDDSLLSYYQIEEKTVEYYHDWVGEKSREHIYNDNCDYDSVSSFRPLTQRDYTNSIIQIYNLNQYTESVEISFRVRAISRDVSTKANGTWSEWSEPFKVTNSVDNTKKALDELVKSGTATEKVESIKSSFTSSSSDLTKNGLKVAMATDAETETTIKNLEEEYKKAQNITVEAPAVNPAVKESTGIDASQIKLVGAALNAGAGEKMGLTVDPAPKKETILGLDTSVQLDIKLTKNGSATTGELDIPVSITIPVPAGLGLKNLVIWHVHGNGTKEQVQYRLNGDGTLTFAVTSFSTFVFGNEKSSDPAPVVETVRPAEKVLFNKSLGANTVELNGIDTLNIDDMRKLSENPDMTLVLNFTYEYEPVKIVIPAGEAIVDEEISWYGPLWLIKTYGNSYGKKEESKLESYIIKAGDTLNDIVEALKTTVEDLLKKNEKITDKNVIFAGDEIKY